MAKTGPAGAGSGANLDELVGRLLKDKVVGPYKNLYGVELKATAAGPEMLALSRADQAALVPRILAEVAGLDPMHSGQSTRHGLAEIALKGLLRRTLPLPDETIGALLGPPGTIHEWRPLRAIAGAVEARAAAGPLGDDLVAAIRGAVARLREETLYTDHRKVADRLARLIATAPDARIDPGEAWSDAALADLGAMGEGRRRAWDALLASCQAAGAGKATDRWIKEVAPLLGAVGRDDFKAAMLHWLPLVDRPRTISKPRANNWEPRYDDLIEPHHVELLKGLARCAATEADRDLARLLAGLALSAYRKIPGVGPRLVALGNASVAALGTMPGMDAVGQLALLRVRVKFGPAQKEAEKALTAAAAREGLPREEIDELAVPAYGMGEVGRRREVVGEFAADLVVEGRDVEVRWSRLADGRSLKSAPAGAKRGHAEEIKELRAASKDVAAMLAAQRERIDGLFLARRRWPVDAWRARYLDHPLVGTIARRLIWDFEGEGRSAGGLWLDGAIVDADGRPIDGLGAGATVGPWHPIGRSIEEVSAWRDLLDRRRVVQPFKQAHREIYVLTDAERATRVYSNRFAAHVLRQHQYHALCGARGWRNKLRLMVDDTYPPTSRDLPGWGLRAEFWVEGLGGHYDLDANEAGSYRLIGTDQVRFYAAGDAQVEAQSGTGRYAPRYGAVAAEPVPLDQIPALVLSEVLRDVDLFVGVASVGNDPNWADGGPGHRGVEHDRYWRDYGFGDLSAAGETRRGVLERLVPRLKIAPRCGFDGRFLTVRGDIRSYKIHLGSGNILMAPNDEYLCIVPRQSGGDDGAAPGGLFLPFEGDRTLSIILSKALMLADDSSIADPSIVSQIRARL